MTSQKLSLYNFQVERNAQPDRKVTQLIHIPSVIIISYARASLRVLPTVAWVLHRQLEQKTCAKLTTISSAIIRPKNWNVCDNVSHEKRTAGSWKKRDETKKTEKNQSARTKREIECELWKCEWKMRMRLAAARSATIFARGLHS